MGGHFEGIVCFNAEPGLGSLEDETNPYMARCASVIAWSYLAEGSRKYLVVGLFAQHQWFVV